MWAIFGNDEDGPYGIYEHTRWGAVKWWLRNPLHNVFWHVVNWPNGPFFEYRKSVGAKKYFRFYIGWRPYGPGPFGIKLTIETKE